MIDDVRLTFGALRDACRPHGEDLAVRALLAGRHDVLLGLDSAGNPHLLIASDEAKPRTSGAAAIVVARHRLEVAGSPATFVDVYCVVDPLAEIFDHLIVAVLDRLERTQDEPSVAVADVIEEWKRLLAAAGAPPGRDRLVAIFGELWYYSTSYAPMRPTELTRGWDPTEVVTTFGGAPSRSRSRRPARTRRA